MAPALEVADIFRRHGEAFRQAHSGHLGGVERRVMGAITACRTAVLGGHVEQCDDCGATRIAYNSCRNRHCPKCQGRARAQWLADRQAELLPVPYFHVVFTLPAPVGEIAFQNKAAVYAILFRAAAETLATIAADPRHLGAKLGMTMVLHTWGQALQHHPHIHCVIPGGRPSLDRTRWVACRPGFFLPVRVLSRLFRRLFLRELENVFDAGKLRFFGKLANLAEPQAFARRLGELRRLNWVVYAKPPFGGPEQVLAYLGRYTHRVAIANSRLLSLADGKVRFTWKDYRAGGKTKVMTLDANESETKNLERVVVDTTVQEKAIAHPTDARLTHRAIEKLVGLAKREGVELRQSYRRVAKRAAIMIGRYTHAHQFKRARRELKFLRTRLGRIIRDIRRKIEGNTVLEDRFGPLLDLALRVRHQEQRQRGPKVYSLHAPEVECIGRGKARAPYEFGCKSRLPPRSPRPGAGSSCCTP